MQLLLFRVWCFTGEYNIRALIAIHTVMNLLLRHSIRWSLWSCSSFLSPLINTSWKPDTPLGSGNIRMTKCHLFLPKNIVLNLSLTLRCTIEKNPNKNVRTHKCELRSFSPEIKCRFLISAKKHKWRTGSSLCSCLCVWCLMKLRWQMRS